MLTPLEYAWQRLLELRSKQYRDGTPQRIKDIHHGEAMGLAKVLSRIPGTYCTLEWDKVLFSAADGTIRNNREVFYGE